MSEQNSEAKDSDASGCHECVRLRQALRDCMAMMDSLRDFVAEGGSRNLVGAIVAIAESDAKLARYHGLAYGEPFASGSVNR